MFTGSTRAEKNRFALRSGQLQAPFVPRRSYADGPFGQVHFRDTGTGFPLVLCPQAPQTSRQFTNVYALLQRRGIRAIGVDMPGFGESDAPGFVPTIEDWAATVPAVLDHLGLEQADVLGHHTGALVATEVALQFPSQVRRLILNGPLPLSEAQRLAFLDWVKEAEIDFVFQADGSHLLNVYKVRNDLYGSNACPETITRYVIEQFSGYGPFWTGHHAAFLYDHAKTLAEIRHPCLILTNSGDQIYENAVKARDIRPDFAFTELEGGGVDIVDQSPVAWADAVARFLDGEPAVAKRP